MASGDTTADGDRPPSAAVAIEDDDDDDQNANKASTATASSGADETALRSGRKQLQLKRRFDWHAYAKQRVYILSWIRQYDQSAAIADAIAGVTLGLTMIPQAIAYAALAGLPSQYGLYSAFVGECGEGGVGSASLLTADTLRYVCCFVYGRSRCRCRAISCTFSNIIPRNMHNMGELGTTSWLCVCRRVRLIGHGDQSYYYTQLPRVCLYLTKCRLIRAF